MIIRAAREVDAAAMARVMVDTYLAAHRDHMPAEAWAKRAQEWTYAESEQGWARELREIASDADTQQCLYVAEAADGELVGLAMGGPAKTEGLPTTGEVYALYVRVSYQGRGLGRRLVQAVATHLARLGMTALHIGCLAANAPGRRFYESLGGQVVAERLVDQEGFMLPELVYGWADTGALVGRPNGEAAIILAEGGGMDLLDRLLGHDRWTTAQLLERCRELRTEQWMQPFDLGHRTLEATFLHMIGNVRGWTELMAELPVQPSAAEAATTADDLIAAWPIAYADFATLAREIADAGRWDATYVDILDDPPRSKTFGGTIAHVITHNMQHRGEIIHMLTRLGLANVLEGDLLSWEQQARPDYSEVQNH